MTQTEATPLLTLCGSGSCPTVCTTGRSTVIVQGYLTAVQNPADGDGILTEVPLELLIQAAAKIEEQQQE